jgi:integrase/recombinase XerD
MKKFTSNLSTHLAGFLEFKHSMGIKYQTSEHYLWHLDQYNLENGNHSTLTKDVVTSWLLKMEEGTESQNRSWIPPVREFGRYLRNIGLNDAYVVEDSFVIRKYHAETYLLAESEIQAFFKECDSYVKAARFNPGMQFVYPAFYRLMYCCGLRTIEARLLKCSAVHLEDGYIDLMHSKGHRDRRLYLSDELIDYFDRYERSISPIRPNRQYFFPGGCSELCSPAAIASTFTRIWIAAGLPHDGKVKPRPYDFSYANLLSFQTFFCKTFSNSKLAEKRLA